MPLSVYTRRPTANIQPRRRRKDLILCGEIGPDWQKMLESESFFVYIQ